MQSFSHDILISVCGSEGRKGRLEDDDQAEKAEDNKKKYKKKNTERVSANERVDRFK